MKHKTANLTSAEDMHHKYGARFWCPSLDPDSRAALDRLRQGDHVKVCHSGERFWCLIVSREGAEFSATVDNDLALSPLNYGDRLRVQERHIYDYLLQEQDA